MGKISVTRRQAFAEALKMLHEHKEKSEIVAYLGAKYLYNRADAYGIANAAKYRIEHPELMTATDEEMRD